MDKDFTKIISPIIKKAGEIMLSATNVEIAEVKQGDVNYVTFYDKKVQDFLIEELKRAFPQALFIAEEKDNDQSALQGELCFIIDPIDGTTNFIRDYKSSSISIGLFSRGEGIFGAILNPYLNELYTAEKGKGAYLNGEKIKHQFGTEGNMFYKLSVENFDCGELYFKIIGEHGVTISKIFKLNSFKV